MMDMQDMAISLNIQIMTPFYSGMLVGLLLVNHFHPASYKEKLN
jgi:hypothetical protein